MTALLDTNVLIALLDAAHVHHARAHAWMARNGRLGWASCAITQNGCVRIMSQPGYAGHRSVAELGALLRRALASPHHVPWTQPLSICDSSVFHLDRMLSSRHLTDVYLLALAVQTKGRLVTFDQGIPVAAVVGFEPKHLVIL
jgi:toxin-antitoxin system PIN domain toxin